MVVGYSHYRKADYIDNPGLTRECVEKVLADDDRKFGGAMFSSVPTYFGDYVRKDFWRKVDFFNFVPDSFIEKKKFATANRHQVEVARTRFCKILSEEMPDKVFIFSRKAWCACPPTLEEAKGVCVPLSNGSDNWGTYLLNEKQIRVCGFRHPMRANKEKMRASVQEFLNL